MSQIVLRFDVDYEVDFPNLRRAVRNLCTTLAPRSRTGRSKDVYVDIMIDENYFEYNATNGIVAIPQPQEFEPEEVFVGEDATALPEPVYSTVPGFERVLISESADEPDVVSTD